MLADCLAIVVSPSRESNGRLADHAERAGFGKMVEFQSLAAISRGRGACLPFCLMGGDCAPDLITKTIRTIRLSPEVDIAMMPVVMLAQTPDAAVISRAISEGLDDIILLPMTARALKRRLSAQLQSVLSYYRTDTYFGPDRRRADQRKGDGTRTDATTAYEVLTIKRNGRTGIRILSSVHHRKIEPVIVDLDDEKMFG